MSSKAGQRKSPKKLEARRQTLSPDELGARYLVSKEVVAHRYSVSPRTIEFCARKRRIPSIKVGRSLRFQVQACARAVEKFMRAAAV